MNTQKKEEIGELNLEKANVLEFPEGMLGLPQYKHYVLIRNEQTNPFLRLQCVDNTQISFLVIDPVFADSGYKSYVLASDPDHIFIDAGEDVVMFVVCTVKKDGSDVTANMQAPVIINHKTMIGRQIILLDSPYSLRHSLLKGAGKQRG